MKVKLKKAAKNYYFCYYNVFFFNIYIIQFEYPTNRYS